jgi:hypothetical protein
MRLSLIAPIPEVVPSVYHNRVTRLLGSGSVLQSRQGFRQNATWEISKRV